MMLPYDAFSRDIKLCLDGRVFRDGTFPAGAGGYADVYKGQFEGRRVAIKVLRPFGLREEKLFRRLWREYLTWSRLSHPNILACLGYSYDFSPLSYMLPSLVSPWMENGAVNSYLRRYPNANRKALLLGIAKGLSYLHTREPVIIHGDLRAGNILVSEHGIPCLTDFGLSRVLEEINEITTSSDLAGAVRWMSPELFNSDGDTHLSVTVKSDVWAYGMTILEILSGERPYSTVKNDLIVLGIIRDGKTPIRPEGGELIEQLDDFMWGICQHCWTLEPSSRPLIGKIITMMSSFSVKAMPADSLPEQGYLHLFAPGDALDQRIQSSTGQDMGVSSVTKSILSYGYLHSIDRPQTPIVHSLPPDDNPRQLSMGSPRDNRFSILRPHELNTPGESGSSKMVRRKWPFSSIFGRGGEKHNASQLPPPLASPTDRRESVPRPMSSSERMLSGNKMNNQSVTGVSKLLAPPSDSNKPKRYRERLQPEQARAMMQKRNKQYKDILSSLQVI